MTAIAGMGWGWQGCGIRSSDKLRRDGRVVVFGAPAQFVETREKAQQSILEGVSEISIEISVDERVEGRIEVTDPENESDETIRTLASWSTKRRDYVPAK